VAASGDVAADMSMLGRLWRGEVPLGEAFWSWAVLGGLLVNALTSLAFLALIANGWPVVALVVGYGLSVPYNVLALVGVWRAADRHEGERAAAEVARIVTLVGFVILTVT
jgi:hypothetical protein